MRFIITTIVTCLLVSFQQASFAGTKLKADNELFDLGLTFGFLSVENFPTEAISGLEIDFKDFDIKPTGLNATFRASESFFIQYNYFQATLGQSSLESNPVSETLAIGDGRKFKHYDLLIGYSLFQGEFFSSKSNTGAHLSALNIVGGIGDTHLGEEDNFTITFGFGYQIEFYRKYVVRFDYRNHTYETTLIEGEDKERAHATQMTVGLGWLL